MTAELKANVLDRSEALARRALGFALDPSLTISQAAVLLDQLAAGERTALTSARVHVLRSAPNGPTSRRAAHILGLALGEPDGPADAGTVALHPDALHLQPPCIVLIGGPGAGKGTQGRRLSDRLAVPHVSTGELLRDFATRRTPLGFRTRQLMANGHLIPDDVLLDLLSERLAEADVQQRGVILDGFPRTLVQAETLATMISKDVDVVIDLVVRPGTAVDRLRYRQRHDDAPETVVMRRTQYDHDVLPLLVWYEHRSTVFHVDAERSVETVTAEVLDHLQEDLRFPIFAH